MNQSESMLEGQQCSWGYYMCHCQGIYTKCLCLHCTHQVSSDSQLCGTLQQEYLHGYNLALTSKLHSKRYSVRESPMQLDVHEGNLVYTNVIALCTANANNYYILYTVSCIKYKDAQPRRGSIFRQESELLHRRSPICASTL